MKPRKHQSSHPSQLRARAVIRIRRSIVEDGYPRVLVAFLVGLSGGFALLSSFAMLKLGLESMAIRYPIALLFGYAFFLFLIWVWLKNNADVHFDIPSTGTSNGSGGPEASERAGESLPTLKGEGGEFGGGGASGSYESSASADVSDGASSLLKEIGEPLSVIAEAEELAIPIYLVIFAFFAAVVMAIASLYVVYIAPLLLAEVLVDGVLTYALFRRVKGLDSPHWLKTAVKRTMWPLIATGFGLCIAGVVLSSYAPGARTIGEALKGGEKQGMRF